jgi:transposase-like protein
MTEHLGHEKNRADSKRGSTNVRNGTRSKTVLSDAAGEVQIDVPRDRDSSFEPQIVKKRQRRLNDVDEIVLSLYAKGMTTGDISAHFADIYGASVSKDTVSRITDKVLGEMTEWSNRPLDPGWFQPVVANGLLVLSRNSLMTSAGVRSPRPARGRRLSSVATRRRSCAVCTERSVLFGKY